MSAIIEKARRGDPAALTSLYESNKSTVYFLCHSLLGEETAARSVALQVFQNTWGAVLEGRINNEQELQSTLCYKVAVYCKNRLLKADPKAFHLPPKKNFLSVVYTPIRIAPESDPLDVILQSLPTLQRYIYVLLESGAFHEKEIAKLCSTGTETVRLACAAEEETLRKIFSAVPTMAVSAEQFRRDLLTRKETCTVPDEMDASALRTIQQVCKPYREKAGRKLRQVVIGLLCAVAVPVIVIGAWMGTHDSSTTDELEETSSAVSTVEDETVSSLPEETDDGDSVSTQEITVVENPAYYADIEIENYGTVTVALDSTYAPETVENFVSLAESGFYDGLTFHRIIEGFMMQGGDPNGDGTGGSDTTITGEFTDNGVENPLSNTRGAIAMARSSDYDSASSQFFIVHEDSTFLDGQYAVFGYVTDGMDVVDAVCTTAEPTDDNGTIESADQPVITSVTIREPETDSDAVTEQ